MKTVISMSAKTKSAPKVFSTGRLEWVTDKKDATAFATKHKLKLASFDLHSSPNNNHEAEFTGGLTQVFEAIYDYKAQSGEASSIADCIAAIRW